MNSKPKMVISPAKALGVCVKAMDWKVEFQNDICEQACGKTRGAVCRKSCRLWTVEEGALSSKGVRVYPFRDLNGIRYDVVVIRQEEGILTFLCPVEKAQGETQAHLSALGLSEREVEVVLLLKEGHTHLEICHHLNIRKGTLKTHLKNIRVKMARQTPP